MELLKLLSDKLPIIVALLPAMLRMRTDRCGTTRKCRIRAEKWSFFSTPLHFFWHAILDHFNTPSNWKSDRPPQACLTCNSVFCRIIFLPTWKPSRFPEQKQMTTRVHSMSCGRGRFELDVLFVMSLDTWPLNERNTITSSTGLLKILKENCTFKSKSVLWRITLRSPFSSIVLPDMSVKVHLRSRMFQVVQNGNSCGFPLCLLSKRRRAEENNPSPEICQFLVKIVFAYIHDQTWQCVLGTLAPQIRI